MAALIAFSSAIDAQNRRTGRSTSINVDDDRPVTSCGDIRVTYDRRPAMTEENEVTLAAAQVSTLQAQLTNSGMYVSGWDRSDYSIKTCKSVPADDADAAGTLRQITTTTANGRIAVNGPSDHEWTANLVIMVPRLSAMTLETRNGPMQLRDLAGNIHLKAANGPISLKNVGGSVEATTTNGPISLTGGSGDQRVSATNGPIHVGLSGSRWDGPGLQVTTSNGPLSISIPDSYNSGVQIETSTRAPVNCKAALCGNALRTANSPGLIRLGNGDPVVRVSTNNGPLSIESSK